MVEIYGLYDPDSGELRYVGKAQCSKERLQRHIHESRHKTRPVCLWVKSLVEQGKAPRVDVLESVAGNAWKAAERRLIAEHRKTSNLLNLAPGGDMPSQTREQAQNAARASNAAQAKVDPRIRRFWNAKKDFARLATTIKKSGDIFGYYCMRFRMQRDAERDPELFGDWIRAVETA